MTQDPYDNDAPLSAHHIDPADEFDGLEVGSEAPKGSKAPVFAVIALILVAGASFLTYQVFLVSPADNKPIAVAPAIPNAVGTETMPSAPVADQTVAPPVPATEENIQAPTEAAIVAPTPEAVTPPADPNAVTAEALPVMAPAETEIVPPAAEAAAVVTPPVPPAAMASVAAALPTPPADQLTPIDPNAATTLPTTPAVAPTAQKMTDTVNAVNEILGTNNATAASAINVQKTAAAPVAKPAKPVEVTPRAKQVIFVKKSYDAASSQATLATGDRVAQAGQYGDAVAIYDRQLQKNPSDPLALAGKAVALQKAGRTAEAMDTYERLIVLNPRDMEALTNYLGLLQKQDPQQALTRLQSLSGQYPENAAVAGQLAATQAGMLDTPNALRNFQKAASLDPTNPTYAFNLGVLYDRLGTTDKAREAYRNALQLAREYPDRASGVPLQIIRDRMGNLSQ